MPNSPPTTPKVVLDASSLVGALSSLVGALLKPDSVPERALLLARANEVVCLSAAVEAEIREVFARPKFRNYLTSGRAERILELLSASALHVEPTEAVADCSDARDNKYLELALAAKADTIVASDDDLLVLDPWRGIRIVSRATTFAVSGGRKGEAVRPPSAGVSGNSQLGPTARTARTASAPPARSCTTRTGRSRSG